MPDDVSQCISAVKTGDRIHENNFVDAVFIITQGEFVRIAHNAQAFKMHPLDEVRTLNIESGDDPLEIIERNGTKQVSDADKVGAWIDEVLDRHPDQVAQLLAGKSALKRFFTGEVMKSSRGEANPAVVARLLNEALEKRRNR